MTKHQPLEETPARARYFFWRHLLTYCLVNLLLVVINLLTSPHSLWFFWPMLGWGIGLAMHAVRAFFPPPPA